MNRSFHFFVSGLGILASAFGLGCNRGASVPKNASAEASDTQGQTVIANPHKDYLKFVISDPLNLPAATLSSSRGRYCGGFLERIEFKEHGGVVAVFVRYDLDENTHEAEGSPPYPETFRCYVKTKAGRWSRAFTQRDDVVWGRVSWRRIHNGNTEYVLHLVARGGPEQFAIISFADGKLLKLGGKQLPTSDEEAAKAAELDEQAFQRWARDAKALPENVESFDPDRQWITLAEFIRSKDPKWHDGAPPSDSNALAKLQESIPVITAEEFKAWWVSSAD